MHTLGENMGTDAPSPQLSGPLTALEWLRVTHADTLSGRRIEEAVAAARAEGRADILNCAACMPFDPCKMHDDAR